VVVVGAYGPVQAREDGEAKHAILGGVAHLGGEEEVGEHGGYAHAGAVEEGVTVARDLRHLALPQQRLEPVPIRDRPLLIASGSFRHTSRISSGWSANIRLSCVPQ